MTLDVRCLFNDKRLENKAITCVTPGINVLVPVDIIYTACTLCAVHQCRCALRLLPRSQFKLRISKHQPCHRHAVLSREQSL